MQTNSTDSAQANKTRQQSLVETVQNRGEIERIPEFIDPEIVDHSRPPGLPEGIDGVRAILGMIRTGFPDHDAKVVHMIAEGDLVATYKTFTGTNTGWFFGAPPTGKTATIRVMDFVRYRDGKVAEHWNIVDMAGLMQQLSAA
jgi:steroid delta-isomerase-like uncharacterized protein